ncbi:BspA family leucine-rich repeat surface protein [Enterococcus sp. ALS3]|uniref:BspA family leucine-rich repeat surface protein n=1 Tax=Enterococcus alishanensis TaxID=1303817 RepID=A0ABS6THW0_9ENTE|nr:BspA family leucine-rich repeat surface protein [Enterococcus alishanensis]MBV7392496.1 BspA family leucine-rich repeat surface protein [Enterococcus alishanensis]
MKKNIFFSILLFSVFFGLFSFLVDDNVQAESIESTWGTSPVTFDTDTGTLTVQSGTIGGNNYIPVANVDTHKIKHIIFSGEVYAPEYSENLFSGAAYYSTFINLESLKGNLDVSNVTSMSAMFSNSPATSIDIGMSDWDTSKVTTMTNMFANSKAGKLDISNWNVSNVETFTNMFLGSAVTELPINNWNVSNATDMNYMFESTKLTTLDLNNWNVSKLATAVYMFSDSLLSSINVSKWDISNLQYIDKMFSNTKLKQLDLSSWDTSSIVSMNGLFAQSFYINSLTLGEKSILNSSVDLNDTAIPDGNLNYTPRWIQSNPEFLDNYYLNSLSFMANYDGSYPGRYTREYSKTQGGNITVRYQDVDGNLLASEQIITGYINDSYKTQKINIAGYTLKDIQGSESGTFSYNPRTITYIYKKDMNSNLVPIWRAYNLNDGDHLYTTSMDEYSWIVGLKWQAEGIAFQSVLSSYEGAVPVYRLYNPNSGEHFYTISEKEYNGVAEKGWSKEQVGFYMVPKNAGNPIYRVFNPNANGPGSHLFTESKDEANWLINQGWSNEGVSFYCPK